MQHHLSSVVTARCCTSCAENTGRRRRYNPIVPRVRAVVCCRSPSSVIIRCRLLSSAAVRGRQVYCTVLCCRLLPPPSFAVVCCLPPSSAVVCSRSVACSVSFRLVPPSARFLTEKLMRKGDKKCWPHSQLIFVGASK